MRGVASTFLFSSALRYRRVPSLLKRIANWQRVARERRRLLDLDPRILADMGLTPEQAATEASRPFWDVRGDR